MHEQRRQAGVLVRHLDRLDPRLADDGGRLLEDLHRLGVDAMLRGERGWMKRSPVW